MLDKINHIYYEVNMNYFIVSGSTGGTTVYIVLLQCRHLVITEVITGDIMDLYDLYFFTLIQFKFYLI